MRYVTAGCLFARSEHREGDVVANFSLGRRSWILVGLRMGGNGIVGRNDGYDNWDFGFWPP